MMWLHTLFLCSLVVVQGWRGGEDPKNRGVPSYWEAENYPNPRLKPQNCGLQRAGWVCDPNEILTNEEVKMINDAAEELRSKTQCQCYSSQCNEFDKHGFTAMVIVVKAMALPPDLSKAEKTKYARRFAEKVRDRFEVGQCDDDLLIFLSKDDRKLWIAAGETVESYTPSKDIEEIYEATRSYFANGEFGRGFTEIINIYKTELTKSSSSLGGWAIALIIVAVLVVFGGCIACAAAGGKAVKKRKGKAHETTDYEKVEIAEKTESSSHERRPHSPERRRSISPDRRRSRSPDRWDSPDIPPYRPTTTTDSRRDAGGGGDF